MQNKILKVESLSKLYRLGQVGTGTISHDLNRWVSKIRGKDDPYAKIGQLNNRTNASENNYVYAIKDISFEVNKGDVLGIIGKNGAGKSTLLKIISRITNPSEGSIKAKGRIASLLEVGTGMHQEMTARENIYLNGLILGMTKSEIKSQFDEIIDFSGCKMYVDTPVKRFSSGMRVRLGFAVAAFLNPDILIVDEVLAVGDAEFQKKAIDRIKKINNEDGRTILFVSHNLASVKKLCNRGLVINNGQLDFIGNVDNAISSYSNSFNNKVDENKLVHDSNSFIKLNSITINKNSTEIISSETQIIIGINFENLRKDVELILRFDLFNLFNVHVIRQEIEFYKSSITELGTYNIDLIIPSCFLNRGKYIINLDFIDFQKKSLLNHENCISFEVLSEVSLENVSKRDVNNAVSSFNFKKEVKFMSI
jgi:lipopolysaccharide transport system ATP-binding protein